MSETLHSEAGDTFRRIAGKLDRLAVLLEQYSAIDQESVKTIYREVTQLHGTMFGRPIASSRRAGALIRYLLGGTCGDFWEGDWERYQPG